MIDFTVFSRNREAKLRHTLTVLEKKIIGHNCNIIVSLNDYSKHQEQKLKAEFPKITFFAVEGLSHDENMQNAIRNGNKEYFWILSDDDDYSNVDVRFILENLSKGNLNYLFVNYQTNTNGVLRRSRLIRSASNKLFGLSLGYSLCSSNIVLRKKWEQFEESLFFGTNFWHLDVITRIIGDDPMRVAWVDEPMIVNIGPSPKESRAEHGISFYFDAWIASLKITKNIKTNYFLKMYLLSIPLITVHWTLYNSNNTQNSRTLKLRTCEVLRLDEKILFRILFTRRLLWLLSGLINR